MMMWRTVGKPSNNPTSADVPREVDRTFPPPVPMSDEATTLQEHVVLPPFPSAYYHRL
jgi:hypothetical protein